MTSFETITLSRDCEAALIPSGEKTMLRKGARVHLTQSLGGSFTIMSEAGYMVRVAGENADALGKDEPQSVTMVDSKGHERPLEDLVWEQLRTCYDPEIPVNIVDLGLIYECKLTPSPEDEAKKDVSIKMTLTAPGCGMGETLKMDAIQKIQALPGVRRVHIDLVWEPPWDRSMMSEAAKLKLGMM